MTFQVLSSVHAPSQSDRRYRILWELKLTQRQLDCLYWTQEGKSAVDIGLILGISPRTVEGHLARACRALGVRTRIQAIVKARELGILEARPGRKPTR